MKSKFFTFSSFVTLLRAAAEKLPQFFDHDYQNLLKEKLGERLIEMGDRIINTLV